MDTALTDGDKKLISDVEQYGFHIVHVLADNGLPGFGFSVGLFHNFKHPEIIIIGLQQELIHSLINDMGEAIKSGKVFDAYSYSPDILEGFECYFIPIDQSNYRNYLGYAHWFYKNDEFPVLQCIYPTVKGIYPWQSDWPQRIKHIQPILGPLNF
ncbi:DUF4262 domain-containing protein [Mucilaginibacter sp. PAMB04274]|uniref:DUF4262 domain-containing protein n=1 Tax=Mucilaginibacter sp. PAMB04274 TaxID=3138568 RepID=UPI0031F60B8F